MAGSNLPEFCLDYRKYTVEMISKPTSEIMSKVRKQMDEIAAVPDDKVSYDSVIGRLADIETELDTFTSCTARLPAAAATEKAVRDAASEAEKALEKFSIELSMRKDIFDKLVTFSKQTELSSLHPQTKRYVEKRILTGKRNGLHLDQETRDKLQGLRTRMSELTIEYMKNCNEDDTWVPFTDAELAGVPDTFLQGLEKTDDGRRKVTVLAPHFIVLKKCSVPDTRRKLAHARAAKCMKANTPLIEEFVQYFHQFANLLGYATNAHYKTEIKMSKTPETVTTFLSDLKEKLQPLWAEERRLFLEYKEEECRQAGVPFDGQIHLWDVSYYSAMAEERKYAVNHEALRDYFPVDRVTRGMFDIYERLLGLRFSRVQGAEVWHDDVTLYRVEEADGGQLTGYFFLDLYPRDGKYDHFCVDSLRTGRQRENGYELPVCVMLANFPKPTADKPALFSHEEVETFFHEFGHAMHCICSRAHYTLFAGTSVEGDFVEAPSQMLENWVWEPEPLALMSGHYRDGAPIPAELLATLVRSRQANSGIFNLRQVALATFDQIIFSQPRSDTAAIFGQVYREVTGIETMPDTNFAASFGHMAGGYDANYYGYLWSEVYSVDMFEARFKKEGILSPEVGRDYRKCILEPGSTIDALDMLKKFLGRGPSPEAFLRSKGLAV
ncbi:thimet oligopeptidase-like isoform X2 [Pollicipes pollicipes]|nr:thimet oligopeptidase-like isoform X2 [Pollicipes pollicipes]XP_037080681.1 thimet oligopeptidase-like isoform X2 [Pollicipes pollicipes]XP_037080682.1 thimet oligopeptidase-like isoform X2 [Pollicipes pollicipes]XP_037080683.1 thimet oligopeptidase-like isoform X2 [Pollicipes pollicipes]XP_037080684.1 thimet oligopeptidase-like isoform X2 [Pollicipes pollicipes]XP_037080685.1 thimet oligopeptidase-like isoform X2 [Pollicipes pollicipes]